MNTLEAASEAQKTESAAKAARCKFCTPFFSPFQLFEPTMLRKKKEKPKHFFPNKQTNKQKRQETKIKAIATLDSKP